jgi:hypothetical protein
MLEARTEINCPAQTMVKPVMPDKAFLLSVVMR